MYKTYVIIGQDEQLKRFQQMLLKKGYKNYVGDFSITPEYFYEWSRTTKNKNYMAVYNDGEIQCCSLPHQYNTAMYLVVILNINRFNIKKVIKQIPHYGIQKQ